MNSKLIRGLSLTGAISIVVGTVIGTGVFLKTRVMTCNVGSGAEVLIVWVISGFLAPAGALTYAEPAAARIPFAMAEDGLFFRKLADVSSLTHVPVNALIVQWIWICVLTLSGSFDTLTDYAMFAAYIFCGLATAAVFIFRKRLPDAERPYRTRGYPVVPVLFLLVTAFLLINTVWTAPLQSLIGLGLIFLGLPLYWYFRARIPSKRSWTPGV